MTLRPIRVLIVDDSATVRETLAQILSSDPGITVIGTAPDPYVAAKRIQQELPDVITLDVEMPRMDGITFLRKLMEQHPIPVVMCSSLDEHSERMEQAMDAGAVDFILKPKLDTRQQLQDARIRICDTVKAAASVHLKAARSPPPLKAAPKLTADAMLPPPRPGSMSGGVVRGVPRTTAKVICIGASTGGTESLRAVLEVLPATSPGIVIVQHMPEKFTAAFSRRLNDLCAVTVKEAEDGDTVTPGLVLIAPGNHHMLLQRSGDRYSVTVKDGPLVSRHRPSVDVLFRSAAHAAGGNGIGVIMTGMGDDGAKGLLEMRHAGAVTVAQDEESCVVFGMPKEAIQLGAVDKVLPLSQIATQILSLGRQG